MKTYQVLYQEDTTSAFSALEYGKYLGRRLWVWTALKAWGSKSVECGQGSARLVLLCIRRTSKMQLVKVIAYVLMITIAIVYYVLDDINTRLTAIETVACLGKRPCPAQAVPQSSQGQSSGVVRATATNPDCSSWVVTIKPKLADEPKHAAPSGGPKP
jgi:hypothetical protein